MNSKVILVNEADQIIGEEEKLIAHQKGLLHRAFSIFIYRYQQSQCEVLLQQRHPGKYHSGGLWTNTCCSHPQPHETVVAAAKRRLAEEMGIMVDLTQIGVFHYQAPVGNDLIENEIDHVFAGEMPNQPINVDPEEIADYRWVEVEALQNDLKQNPQNYTAWLASALAIFSNRQ